MKPSLHFSKETLADIRKRRLIGIRAGTDSAHRVIRIWVVVVHGRVFIRSWTLEPRSWWRTFLEDPHGSLFLGRQEIHVRAIHTRSERLKDLVSVAYKEKYDQPDDIQYVKDMSRKKSRDATVELVVV